MKILFFIDSLTSGGKERRLSQLLKGVSLNPDIEFKLAIMSTDIHYKEVLNLKMEIEYIIRRTKKDISVFYKFYKLCRTFKPDIVHCWDSMTAIYSVPACRFLNITLINGMVVDTPVQRNIFNKYWLRSVLTFPFSNMIVGNSMAGLEAYNAPEHKSVCIYNGMDLSRFENLQDPILMRDKILGNSSSDLYIIGMVAAFEKRKDYPVLIRSAISLSSARDNIRFILVGDGSDLQNIKESIPESLSEKIIFLGKRSDVESIINIINIGVLLTNVKVHGEGISNSIIEYMALGKPVIATRGGGTNEVVMDNYNGFLIDPDNPDQLSEKISMLIDNKNLIDELGNNGKKMAEEMFKLEIMTQRYFSLYNEVLKNN